LYKTIWFPKRYLSPLGHSAESKVALVSSIGDLMEKAALSCMKNTGLLVLLFLFCSLTGIPATKDAAPIPYGNNPKAGHFFQVDDAKVYYEIYGSGEPLVLLHGGLYGYIDEFGEVIPELSRHYTVIAIALRGHGKSEMGTKPLSNALFAEDSAAVIRHVTNKPVNLVGFSVGAMTSYLLTINHPDLVRRLIAVGGPIGGTEPWLSLTNSCRQILLSAATSFTRIKPLGTGLSLP
jgi:predicted alpha/beta-fold hydrolase